MFAFEETILGWPLRMDYSAIPPPPKKKVMEDFFRGRRQVGKSRSRQVNAIWRNAVYVFQIWICKTRMNKEGWRKEIEEITGRSAIEEEEAIQQLLAYIVYC